MASILSGEDANRGENMWIHTAVEEERYKDGRRIKAQSWEDKDNDGETLNMEDKEKGAGNSQRRTSAGIAKDKHSSSLMG